jgi:hypothetical protein
MPSEGEQHAVKIHNGGITATTAFLIAIDKTAKAGTADLSAPAQHSFPLQQRFSEESCYFRQLAGAQWPKRWHAPGGALTGALLADLAGT